MTNAPTTLRLAGGAQGFNWLPVFVADEQGMFARQGLAIEYLRMGSVDKATKAVLNGDADLAITPPEGAVANYVAGGPLRIVASNSERLPMSLVARAGITDLAGLRGKRIGTSSYTEGTAIYTRLMLDTVGLSYPDDFEFVLAGVHTTRWQALQNGEIDAAPQPAPWNFLAQREGFVVLGEISDVIPQIIFAGLIGAEPWLSQHPGIVKKLIAALAHAHDFVNNPDNDDVTLPIYQRLTTPDDAGLATRGLEYTRSLGMWPNGLTTSPEALVATIDAMIAADLLAPEQRERAFGAVATEFNPGSRA